GYAQLDLAERRELQVAVQRAFEGVSRMAGLDRSLVVVRDELGAHTIALFSLNRVDDLRPIAAVPSFDAARRLLPGAQLALAAEECRLEVGGGSGGSLVC